MNLTRLRVFKYFIFSVLAVMLIALILVLFNSSNRRIEKLTEEKEFIMNVSFDNSVYIDSVEYLKVRSFTDSCFKGSTRKVSDYVFFIKNIEKIKILPLSREEFYSSYNPRSMYGQVEQYDQDKVLWKIIYHVWLSDGERFTTEYLIKTINTLEDSGVDPSIYLQCLDYCLYYYCLYSNIKAGSSLERVLPGNASYELVE